MIQDEAARRPVRSDPGMIATFATFVFGDLDGWVAVRAFTEKGDGKRRQRLPFHRADGDLATKLAVEARAAAEMGLALHVVPGTVAGPGKATAADVIAMRTILVDLDHGDIREKHEHLTRHLGPPSLEVASGGITDEGQDRLHLYWRLNKPITDDNCRDRVRSPWGRRHQGRR